MNIAVSTASGASARVLKAGMYRIVVRDRSTDHNFRLAGPGVSKTTSIEGTGNATWTVRLVRGKTYRFWCDPHSDEMRGSFRMK